MLQTLIFFFRKLGAAPLVSVTGFTHIENEQMAKPYVYNERLLSPHVGNEQLTIPVQGTENL